MKVIVILLAVSLLFAGCNFSETQNAPVMGKVNTNVTYIVDSSPPQTHDVFYVEVTPNNAVAGETYYLCLYSRDGYYFENQFNVVTWTQDELVDVSQDERNYTVIEEAQERQKRKIEFAAPITDIAVRDFNNDYRTALAEKRENTLRDLQEAYQKGDWVEYDKIGERSLDLTDSELNNIFHRYFKIVVTDKQGFLKILYPEGEIHSILSHSAKGSFDTPVFTPQYEYLIVTISSLTGGKGEGGLYSSDGKLSYGGTLIVQPDGEGKPHMIHVNPGDEYYYSISVPDEMDWSITIEETNYGRELLDYK